MKPPLSRLIVNRTPALLLAGAALAGTLFIALDSMAASAAAIIVSSAILFLFRKEPLAFPLYAVVFTAFAVWTAALKPTPVTEIAGEIHGTIEEITVSPHSRRAYVNTTRYGRIALIVTDIIPEISEGDIVSFHGSLTTLQKHVGVPFHTSEHLNSMAARISGTVVVYPDDIEVIGHNNSLNYRFMQHRRDLADIIHSSPLSSEAAGVLSTAVFATDDVNPDTRDNFRVTGLSHLLCVSGFHVGVVAALVMLILSPMRLTGRRMTLRYALAVVLIWIYALIAGMSASVIRAAVMLTLFAVAKITQRRACPQNTLLLAFCAVLAINPWQLFSAGFQLSFAAVAGILLLARKLNPFAERNRLWFKTASVFTVPVAALLATAPLMLLWFQRLPLLSVPVNAVGTLIFPLFITVSGAGVVLWYAGLPSAAVIHLGDRLFDVLKNVVDGSSGISERYSLIMMPSIPEIAIITLILALLVYALHINRHRKAVIATGLCLMGVFAGCRMHAPEPSLYIDGDSRGTDIVVARPGAVKVFTSGRRTRPLSNTAPFLAAYGCDSAVIYQGEKITDRDSTQVAFLADGNHHSETGVLVVTRHSAKRAPGVIASLRPKHVVIGADVGKDSRLRIERTCRRSSVPFTDLRKKAFFENLDPTEK